MRAHVHWTVRDVAPSVRWCNPVLCLLNHLSTIYKEAKTVTMLLVCLSLRPWSEIDHKPCVDFSQFFRHQVFPECRCRDNTVVIVDIGNFLEHVSEFRRTELRTAARHEFVWYSDAVVSWIAAWQKATVKVSVRWLLVVDKLQHTFDDCIKV